MKYYFTSEGTRVNFNAGTKAVNDTVVILEKAGYKPLKMGTVKKNGSSRVYKALYCIIIEIYHILYLLFTKSSNDIYFLQWPQYHVKLKKILYWVIKYKCKHTQILIHDINSLRGFLHERTIELRFFSKAELIIVHTEMMKSYLVKIGISQNKIKILTSFDYLTDDHINIERKNSNTIVYAGNLLKSLFLEKIQKEHCLNINCYGREMPYFSPYLYYKGAFKSENVSVLDGSWGLVWDGISIDCCTGDFGDYLRYNAPHKLSLYIVAGIPIIIWKDSGLAEYVLKNNLGIAVRSILEINEAINEISDMKYREILTNLEMEAHKIRAGKHLLECLK